MSILPVQSTVLANAEISPSERHLISASSSGFVEAVHVRSGDIVEKDQLLLTLDKRELALKVARNQVDVDRLNTELRGAMADHDRKAMAITQASLDSARAELSLAEIELERAEIRAPSAGFVLGDVISQASGAPINRGDALLEIAPASGHEVHLFVDEADVHAVHLGRGGELALKSSPSESIRFTVTEIRPIAESSNGKTRFRVVASPVENTQLILPGQTGIAHIEAEKHSALHVMSKRVTRWFSERWWVLFG